MPFCPALVCPLVGMLPANLKGVASLEHLRARVGGSELRAHAWSGERAEEGGEEKGSKEERRARGDKRGAGARSSSKARSFHGRWWMGGHVQAYNMGMRL